MDTHIPDEYVYLSPFDRWCEIVSGRLVGYCGRSLADLPAGVESALNTWFSHGVSAWVVAYCLALVAPTVKATLNEKRGIA